LDALIFDVWSIAGRRNVARKVLAFNLLGEPSLVKAYSDS
jgi:hypothetical protein